MARRCDRLTRSLAAWISPPLHRRRFPQALRYAGSVAHGEPERHSSPALKGGVFWRRKITQVAAQQQLDEHRALTLETLRDYPEALTRIPGTVLEVPTPPTYVEELIAAHLAWLDALERAQGRLKALSPGGVPLYSFMAADPHALTGAFRGDGTFIQRSRSMANTWLDAYRQFSTQPQ